MDPPVEVGSGGRPRSVAVGNFDVDGIQDVAVANSVSGNMSIFLGNGDGTLRLADTVPVGTTPFFVTAADLNADTIADLAVANSGSGTVSILLGRGDGSFEPARSFAAGTLPRSVAISDLNGDTIPDLAVANEGSGNVSLLLGSGDGTFAFARNLVVPSANFVVASDLDGDGTQDLAVSSLAVEPLPSTVAIFLGTGDATFLPMESIPVGTTAVSIAVTDFNGDAVPDLAVANRQSGTVSVLIGMGGGRFAPAQNYQVGGQPSSVAAGDFNGDAIADVVTANQYSSLSVLMGNGDGTFQLTSDFWGGVDPVSVGVGDFNGDSRADVVVANLNSNNVAVVLNDTPQPGDGVTVLRDIVYYDGPDFNPQRHILDVYLPANRTDFPVVFFVHGGGFRNLNKGQSGLLARTLAREGLGVVMPNYRQSNGSPEQVVHPGHIEDVARAFAWMYTHVADFGGSLDKIILMAHSSGSHLTALLATDPRYLAAHGLSRDVIKGVIGVSGGTYNLTDLSEAGIVAAFGSDPEGRRLASPITYVSEHQPPFLLMYADNDLARQRQQNEEFHGAIRNAGAEVEELHVIPGRNHVGMIGRAARPGDPVRELMLRFIAERTTPLAAVASVTANDGSAQRSRVTSLTVTFSSAVTLAPGAFELVRQGDGSVNLGIATSVVDGRTVAVLTFSGPGILAGSLADGNYTLIIRSDRIHDSLGRDLDGDGDGTPGGDRVEAFFRLFGDTDGDRDVDLLDFARLVRTFGRRAGHPSFLGYLDYNGDDLVGIADLLAFIGRLGVRLDP